MKKHYDSIDFLRVFCTILIVLVHVTAGGLVALGDSAESSVAAMARSIHSICNSAVPVFLMITGYLWLDCKKACTYKKVLPNVLKFILALFTVGLAYALMEHVFNTRGFTISLVARSMIDVLTGNLWDHMWYVYAIIGIYLVLPVIKPFFNTTDRRGIFYLTLMMFFFAIICPYVSERLGYVFPVNFPIEGLIFYVFVGGLLNKYEPSKKVGFPALGVLIACILIIICGGIFSFEVDAGFRTPVTCAVAVSMFIVFNVFFKDYEAPMIIKDISKCSWGIYLLHPLFINILLKGFKLNPLNALPLLSSLLWCALVFVMSYLTVHILRKIPFVGKYIF